MFKIWCSLYIFIIVVICGLIALDSEKCKEKPKEKHCLIEWAARNKWPHTIRWVFDWATSRCHEIRWSDHCPKLPLSLNTNNWPSEDSCLNECSGWA